MIIYKRHPPLVYSFSTDASLIIITCQTYIYTYRYIPGKVPRTLRMDTLHYYWPFVRGGGGCLPVVGKNSPQKGPITQNFYSFHFSLAWTDCWTNSIATDDLRRHDVRVIWWNVSDIFLLIYQNLSEIWLIKCPTNTLRLYALNLIYSITPLYKIGGAIYYHSSYYWHSARAINAMFWSFIPWSSVALVM